MISIEMFPAGNGDCLLVSFDNYPKSNILIDSGYVSTYEKYLKDKLIKLRKNNEKLSLYITTHLHSDHIAGGISFLKDNCCSSCNNIIEISEIWHNSLRHLGPKINETVCLTENEEIILKSLITSSVSNLQSTCKNGFNNISAKQGSSFGSLILKGGYRWNESFRNNAVSIKEHPYKINLTDDISITLLSPYNRNLVKLDKYWRKELKKYNRSFNINKNILFDDAFEFLMFDQNSKSFDTDFINRSFKSMDLDDLAKSIYTPDETPVNGSSISFIIEYKGSKLLFLGDSHAEDIVLSLNHLKRFNPSITLQFNCVKISHHGSKFNTSPELLNLIDSEIFLISTNGEKHNHPDLETLSRIICRSTRKKRFLYFNYEIPVYSFLNNNKLMNQYNYKVEVKNKILI